jgi:hypothetical protein
MDNASKAYFHESVFSPIPIHSVSKTAVWMGIIIVLCVVIYLIIFITNYFK